MEGVKFYYAVSVYTTDARVVAKLSDQTPLLLEKKIGEGRVLLFTSGLDNLTNDFPLHPIFVPFVEQTARYLSGTERRSGSRLVDSFLELRTAKEQAVSVEVIDPGGHRPLSLQEATTAQSYQLTQAELLPAPAGGWAAGFDWRQRGPPRIRSCRIIPDGWRWRFVDRHGKRAAAAGFREAAQGQAAPEQKSPYSLWWYAMLLVLASAVAESLLASRYLGMRRDES